MAWVWGAPVRRRGLRGRVQRLRLDARGRGLGLVQEPQPFGRPVVIRVRRERVLVALDRVVDGGPLGDASAREPGIRVPGIGLGRLAEQRMGAVGGALLKLDPPEPVPGLGRVAWDQEQLLEPMRALRPFATLERLPSVGEDETWIPAAQEPAGRGSRACLGIRRVVLIGLGCELAWHLRTAPF